MRSRLGRSGVLDMIGAECYWQFCCWGILDGKFRVVFIISHGSAALWPQQSSGRGLELPLQLQDIFHRHGSLATPPRYSVLYLWSYSHVP